VGRKTTYISIAVAGLALSYALLFLPSTSFVDAYIDEDGVVEWLGALGLLAAAAWTLCALLRERGRRGARGDSLKRATTVPRPASANLFSFADLRTALRFRRLR
jgi:hypothetical protein